MEEYRYSYLIVNVLFALIWIALYYHRKDLRQEMVSLSLPLGFLGLVLTIPYANDWWKPLTVTGSLPGIEDFVFGFTSGGIAAVLYTELFAKHVRRQRATKQWRQLQLAKFWQLLLIAISAFFVLHYGIGLNTFTTTMTIFVLGTVIGATIRPDLIPLSILTGIFLVLIATALYNVTELFTPGWTEALWTYENIPRALLFNMPAEEIIFYFFYGMIIGPMYEYLIHGTLVSMEVNRDQGISR